MSNVKGMVESILEGVDVRSVISRGINEASSWGSLKAAIDTADAIWKYINNSSNRLDITSGETVTYKDFSIKGTFEGGGSVAAGANLRNLIMDKKPRAMKIMLIPKDKAELEDKISSEEFSKAYVKKDLRSAVGSDLLAHCKSLEYFGKSNDHFWEEYRAGSSISAGLTISIRIEFVRNGLKHYDAEKLAPFKKEVASIYGDDWWDNNM